MEAGSKRDVTNDGFNVTKQVESLHNAEHASRFWQFIAELPKKRSDVGHL